MNIFNSLGSNYNLDFVLKGFTGLNRDKSSSLRSFLENKYKGKVILVYKGREALELALRLLDLPNNSSVVVNGFTCYAVYKAIANANLTPCYLDITEKDLNFSPDTLRSELKKNSNIKVVIIQNTLGYPCDVEEVIKICRERKIFLIEDLAHSIGTTYNDRQEAGQVGDFTILSFSQDKIIDSVSGGALVIRNKDYQQKELPSLEKITNKQQFIDRFYPFFTFVIRATYQIEVGKLIHAVLKKSGLLSSPMGEENVNRLFDLPNWYSSLAYGELQNLQGNLAHRREIAFVYAREINPEILMESVINSIPMSTNLRFPIFVKNRLSLIKYLKNYGIYVSDIWYDAPIAPKKYMSMTDYKNQCPESEKISEEILNLPTHQNVSEKQAKEISERINQWLKLH